MSSDASVFSLLTKLCEHQLSLSGRNVRNALVMKLRKKCFETLLFHNKPAPDPYWLANHPIEDQFLTWQFILQTCKRPQHAQQLEECYKTIQDFDWDPDTKESFLTFLMKLRRLPKEPEEVESDKESTDNIPSLYTNRCQFIRPLDASQCDLFRPEVQARSFVTEQNAVENHISTLFDFWGQLSSTRQSNSCTPEIQPGNAVTEEDSETSQEQSIGVENSIVAAFDFWDQIAHMSSETCNTWETAGQYADIPENSFVTENEDMHCTLDHMCASKTPCMRDAALLGKRALTSEEYLRDVKFLLIGVQSVTFPFIEGTFIVNPDAIFIGITRDMFLQYCELLINCGICYKALTELTSKALANAETYGIIYQEFCNTIKRFLLYYHAATFKLEGQVTLLQFHKICQQLSQPLYTMASLCKVGLFKEREAVIPTGVDLLNYLYKKTFIYTDVNLIYILVGLLFPCYQQYFIQFLRPWLLEGTVKDPFCEFFIHVSERFFFTQNRQYWSRAFSVVDELVPWFLSDLAKTILHCGKSVHLLKQCQAQSRIFQYFLIPRPNLIQVCLTQQMLLKLERNMKAYELSMLTAAGGTSFTLKDWLAKKEDDLLIFRKGAAVKRYREYRRIQTARLERIEKEYRLQKNRYIEKQKDYEEQLAARQEYNMNTKMQELMEEGQLLLMRKNIGSMIMEEASRMVKHYKEISQNAIDIVPTIVDTKREVISRLKTIESLLNPIESTEEDPVDESQDNLEPLTEVDIMNANEVPNTTAHIEKTKENIKPDLDNNVSTTENNFANAQRNKQKVMSSSIMTPVGKPRAITKKILTEAQQNKLKVIAEEYGESLMHQSDLTQNRNNALKSQIVFDEDIVNKNLSTNDTNKNQSYVKENIENNQNEHNQSIVIDPLVSKDSEGNVISSPTVSRQERDLNLELQDFGAYKAPPYVVTPIYDFGKCATLFVGATTATTSSSNGTTPTDEDDECSMDYAPMRLTVDQAKDICVPIMDNFIRHSIMLPLNLQTSLVNEELLKFYIDSLQYLTHLETLRSYFFFLDGEYCQSITKDFFERLYTINFSALWELQSITINIPTNIREDLRIRLSVDTALRMLDLSDIRILDCITVVYTIDWPLTVLIPKDALEKYDDIFKFLLKIHRVAWILQKMFTTLRLLNKSNVRRVSALRISPHYQRVQLCRHIMTHFIQTLQNYIVGEVLHSGWTEFQTALKSIDDIDSLYSHHANYLMQIHFLCLLNKKASAASQVVINIFTVILKYNDYLRSKQWSFSCGIFEHPNFDKLEAIFENFLELARHFFKVGTKLANSACQPQLAQLIDMLNVNNFYSSML